MDNEEFCIEDYEDEFRDAYCNEHRCYHLLSAQNGDNLRDNLEQYVRDLFKDLYIFPKAYTTKSIEDIYTDLQGILSAS